MSRVTNRLQFRDFRLIAAIAETGQLALAAERLAISQPAASRLLASIEHAVGAALFFRHPKGMTPTPAGEALARNGLALLDGLEQAAREVDAVGSGRAGRVRVGAVTGAAVAFVAPAVRRLKQDASGAELHLDVAPSKALVEGLLRGEYDFVLSRLPPGTDARLFDIQPGRVEAILFLARAGHPLAAPLAATRKRRLAELAGYEWVIQAPDTPIRQAVETAFVERQVPLPGEIVNTPSLLAMIAYVNSTDAIAPASREVADLLGPAGIASNLAAIELDEPLEVQPYHLISRRDQLQSPIAARLKDLVVEALAGE